jgi:hypothetical protein
MKKTILTAIVVAGAMTLFGQTTMKKIAKSDYFFVQESITNSDTMVYYYFSFQNMKYSHITDLGSILLHKKEQITELAKSLTDLVNTEAGVTVSVQKKEYGLALYDFSKNIYLSDNKGKYTTMTKKQATKLSEELLRYVELLKQ